MLPSKEPVGLGRRRAVRHASARGSPAYERGLTLWCLPGRCGFLVPLGRRAGTCSGQRGRCEARHWCHRRRGRFALHSVLEHFALYGLPAAGVSSHSRDLPSFGGSGSEPPVLGIRSRQPAVLAAAVSLLVVQPSAGGSGAASPGARGGGRRWCARRWKVCGCSESARALQSHTRVLPAGPGYHHHQADAPKTEPVVQLAKCVRE